ncbi:MAG TPA: amino acid ABC transporter permease [Anaerolineae bacterium]|nr:amino acid ABC transporter permease [Anaerolineae bacterium]
MSVTEKGSQDSAIRSRLTFSEQMRHFPWWAIIMIAGLTLAFIWMMGSETYQQALNFIIRPPTSTEVAFGVEIRNGLMMTLFTTLVAYMIALIFGLFLGVMRVSKNPILFHASTLYVELMRGVPMLVLIIWIGFVVVPFLRLQTDGAFPITGVQGAILGLGFGYAAYLAEVYRSGIESISHGQMEAARSLGMGYFQSMRYVILPQAIRRVVPPLANDLVALLKDSALVSVVAVPEILQMARLFVSRTFRAFEGYNSAAFVYLVLTLVFIIIVRLIERRWRTNV